MTTSVRMMWFLHRILVSNPKAESRQGFDGQATKGTRWMPRRQEAMKGVVSCEKLR